MVVNVEIPEVSGNMTETTPPPQKFSFSTLTTKIPRFNEIWSFIRQNLRPWSEFFNFNNFKSIGNFQRLSSRFLRNCNYFLMNYLAVSFVLVLYCLITSPLILLVIGGLMYASYRVRQIQGPVVLFGKLFSVNQLCIALNIAGIPILYWFGAGNIMFWVVGASTLVVALHASFYNIDAIVTEEFDAFLADSETV
ncbi:prenylated Rab acceptor protein 1 [Sitodiplosis mosellana]|uniref:prenylated Rab acceptor protein 1 n=1 Tax=Sitodiplosis mosellana TaxID=263140 RepID=UPI002444DCD1|nr:prenylated Rab acceptor protein 1 [Sitodiplosis mosellana]